MTPISLLIGESVLSDGFRAKSQSESYSSSAQPYVSSSSMNQGDASGYERTVLEGARHRFTAEASLKNLGTKGCGRSPLGALAGFQRASLLSPVRLWNRKSQRFERAASSDAAQAEQLKGNAEPAADLSTVDVLQLESPSCAEVAESQGLQYAPARWQTRSRLPEPD